MEGNNNNNYNNGVPGPAGGSKRVVPADTFDTPRGGSKGDPQRKVVGKVEVEIISLPKHIAIFR